MRYALLACLLLIAVPAHAQDQSTEYPLVDQRFRIAPGVQGGDCFDIPTARVLTINASSPEGRTGETARLMFYEENTDPPSVYLEAVLAPEIVISRHAARAGKRYCYSLQVSHALTSILPADAPERPYKVVDLKIISTPYQP